LRFKGTTGKLLYRLMCVCGSYYYCANIKFTNFMLLSCKWKVVEWASIIMIINLSFVHLQICSLTNKVCLLTSCLQITHIVATLFRALSHLLRKWTAVIQACFMVTNIIWRIWATRKVFLLILGSHMEGWCLIRSTLHRPLSPHRLHPYLLIDIGKRLAIWLNNALGLTDRNDIRSCVSFATRCNTAEKNFEVEKLY